MPTALRIAQGNPGKRPLPQGEPEIEAADPVEFAKARSMPRWYRSPAGGLSQEEAKARRSVWRHYVALIAPLNVATVVDADALAQLCVARLDYLAHDATIREEGAHYESRTQAGSRTIKQHPAAQLRDAAWRRVQEGLREFGLTPVSRTKVKVAGAGEEIDDDFSRWERDHEAT